MPEITNETETAGTTDAPIADKDAAQQDAPGSLDTILGEVKAAREKLPAGYERGGGRYGDDRIRDAVAYAKGTHSESRHLSYREGLVRAIVELVALVERVDQPDC